MKGDVSLTCWWASTDVGCNIDLKQQFNERKQRKHKKWKRNETHKEGKNPCPHCGKFDHRRITSRLCPLNTNYCHKKQKEHHLNNQNRGEMKGIPSIFGKMWLLWYHSQTNTHTQPPTWLYTYINIISKYLTVIILEFVKNGWKFSPDKTVPQIPFNPKLLALYFWNSYGEMKFLTKNKIWLRQQSTITLIVQFNIISPYYVKESNGNSRML